MVPFALSVSKCRALRRSSGCGRLSAFIGDRNSPCATLLREQGRGPASAGVRNATPRCAGSAAVLTLRSRRKTPFARCALYGQTVSASQITKRAARADLRVALLAVAHSPRHWPARGLAEKSDPLDRRTPRWCSQGRGWAAAGRACSAARSTGLVAARASELRQLTRCVCLSAANGGSSATGHKTEHRSAVAAQRRPPHRSARRWPSLGLARKGCRGSRKARWSH